MSQGTRLQKAWEELKKGGKAPPIAAIFKYLEDDKQMMTREEVLDRIHSYFLGIIDSSVDDVTGEEVYMWKTAPTKSGLSLALGIDHSTLADYCNGVNSAGKPLSERENAKRKIANSDLELVRKAVAIIESYYETSLTNGRNPTGAIFWLLNRDSERWTNDHTKNVVIEHRTSGRLTADEIAAKHGVVIDGDCHEVPQPRFLLNDGGNQNEQQEG